MYSYGPCMAFSGGGGSVGGRLGTRGSGWVQNEPREAKGGEPSEAAHSVTTLCLFAERLQIDPLTLPSGTVYFSKL